MRVAAVLMAVFASGVGSAAAGSDIYQPEEYVARSCSSSGDVCVGIFRSNGFVFQLMTARRSFSSYTLCVRSPRGSKTCRTLPVNRQGSVWGSHKRWPRHFGDSSPGIFRVTWSHAGRPLGRTLRFKQR